MWAAILHCADFAAYSEETDVDLIDPHTEPTAFGDVLHSCDRSIRHRDLTGSAVRAPCSEGAEEPSDHEMKRGR